MPDIYDGNDPNLVLPNARSINPMSTRSFNQIYGKLDGSGVTLDTRGIMLPEGFRDIQAWRDFVDSVDETMGSEIATYIENVLGLNDPYASTINPRIDRGTLLLMIGSIGFKYRENDIFSLSDLRRFVRHSPKFWTEKGNRNFIQYMSYVVNAQLTMQYLWTNDYVTFLPEGSSLIGRPVWESVIDATATLVETGIGDGLRTSFPLTVMNGPVDSVAGTPTVYLDDWNGRVALTPGTNYNFLLQSTSIGVSTGPLQAWSITSAGLVVASVAMEAPDGTSTASSVSGAAPTDAIYQNMTNTGSNLSQCTSIFVYTPDLVVGQKVRFVYSEDTGSGMSPITSVEYRRTASGLAVDSEVGGTGRIYNVGGGWYRVTMIGSRTLAIPSRVGFYPGVTHSTPVRIWGAQSGVGTVLRRLLKTVDTTLMQADLSFSGGNKVADLTFAPDEGSKLLWSGTYSQTGTWYPTSHVYITYDVDKFRGSVSNNFNSQDSLAAFFYTIAPIELVIRSFVLNLNLEPVEIMLGGDIRVAVYTPMEVAAQQAMT